MTNAQRVSLMAELWPNACRAQGWNENDRALRMRVLSDTVGWPLQSANDIDSHDGFTKVKARLKMLADSLQGAKEDGNLDPNWARIRRYKIHSQVKCLAFYPHDNPMGKDKAREYAREVIRDLGRRAGFEPAMFDEAAFNKLVSGLELRESDYLVKALDRALNNKKTGFRVKAGHSLHDMKTMAGVKCYCVPCKRHRDLAGSGLNIALPVVPAAAAAPAPEHVEDDNAPF